MNQNIAGTIYDRSHFTGVRCIEPDKLVASLRDNLGKNMAITSGRYEYDCVCSARDLAWNHMDHHHRPPIHNTYQEAVRFALGNDFTISVTKLRLLGIPFLVTVSEVRFGPGAFYQSMTLLGVFYVHIIITVLSRPTPEGEKSKVIADWHIASHRLFKLFHGILSRKLERLGRVQTEEDSGIRDRRAELRGKGYVFSSDEPDFISSNALTLNTLAPPIEGVLHVELASLPEGRLTKVMLGVVELLVERRADQSIVVWPGACPHEGADLALGERCDKDIVCQWHGLRFAGTTLSPAQPSGRVGLLELRLEGTDLQVRQRELARRTPAPIA